MKKPEKKHPIESVPPEQIGRGIAIIAKNGKVAVFEGILQRFDTLEEIRMIRKEIGKAVIFLIPFNQIQERGTEYEAHGTEPIIALLVNDEKEGNVADYQRFRRGMNYLVQLKAKGLEETETNRAELLLQCPPEHLNLKIPGGIQPSMSDEEFMEMVEAGKAEIRAGNVSQVVLSRKFTGQLEGPLPNNREYIDPQAIFANIVEQRGQYMSFFIQFEGRTIMAASPERHLEIRDGKVIMNPIAGTMKKGDFATFEKRLHEFLADPKETDELAQVLDEELKMMAVNCPRGGRVQGPYLRETGAVIHTEYLLEGESGIEPVAALRNTLHAPTLVGSPLASASRIIKAQETESRGYYGGEFGVIDSDGSMDSAIAIRMLDLEHDGHFTVQAGAGIVKDSDPAKEAEETRLKAAGMLSMLSDDRPKDESYLDRVDMDLIQRILAGRNKHLSKFHLESQEGVKADVEELKGKKILIINNEDNFAHMLGHMVSHMGATVEVIDTFDYNPPIHLDADLVILGPGPGDINESEDARMDELHAITETLDHVSTPILGICLGHQALAKYNRMDVVRQDEPTQGMQKEVTLFGEKQKVGFYNSFAVRGGADGVESDLDEKGNVIAMRSEKMEGFQFHPESVMSENGYEILRDALVRLIGKSNS